MTAPELDLMSALAEVVGADRLAAVRSWSRSYDPVADLDEDSLRRMHQGGLSKHARREQRRPVPLRVDEYGYGNDGRWYAALDGRWSA